MPDLPQWGVLRERSFTHKGNYLVYISWGIYKGIFLMNDFNILPIYQQDIPENVFGQTYLCGEYFTFYEEEMKVSCYDS